MDMRKRGQIQLSFSMIFSIILIVAFITVAIYFIVKIMYTGESAQVTLFYSELQENVNIVWRSGTEQTYVFKDRPLPAGIKYICFMDFNKNINNLQEVYDDLKIYENRGGTIFLYPRRKTYNNAYFKLEHIDVEAIAEEKNPYCIPNDGSPELKLSIKEYDKFVKIE